MTTSARNLDDSRADEAAFLHGFGFSTLEIAAIFDTPLDVAEKLVADALARFEKEAFNAD